MSRPQKYWVLAPQTGGTFRFVQGHYDTMYGRIESQWRRLEEGEGVEFRFTVPANTTALLQLPVKEGMTVKVKEGADFAQRLETLGSYRLPAGRYVFILL